MPTTHQTYYRCSGNFYDSGGLGGYYTAYQNRTVTICPTNPNAYINFNFTDFEVEDEDWWFGNIYDYLEVYDGNSATGDPRRVLYGTLADFVITGNAPGECLTFRFISDGSVQLPGWVAQISCVLPPEANINDNSDVELCHTLANNSTGNSVSVNGSSSTGGTYSINQYLWNWGDNSSSTSTSPSATHNYTEPGIYRISLRVRSGTNYYSVNEATKKVIITPPPLIEFEEINDISCGETINLSGLAKPQNVNANTPTLEGATIALPDEVGVSFISALDFNGLFTPGQTLTAACYPKVTFEIEHSWSGDLDIDLIAPNNVAVRLFDGSNSTRFGWCANEEDDEVPGCPAFHTVVNSGGRSWTTGGPTTTVTSNCSSYTGECRDGNYFLRDQTWNSNQSFNPMLGTPMNGFWSLRITDNISWDDGFIQSWRLEFPQNCYYNLEQVAPDMINTSWSGDFITSQTETPQIVTPTTLDLCPAGVDCSSNQITNTATVGPFDAPGVYTYTFTVEDEFGCEYSDQVSVNVNAPVTSDIDHN